VGNAGGEGKREIVRVFEFLREYDPLSSNVFSSSKHPHEVCVCECV
jgi:hypothetical protein